ncbi:MAG TPA: PIG-L family deacetylase [Candidatus Bathyarchaeia archaeon]|nr:PIG-L family deacetylase [Candidatus Bathyarchaeia archaeon]
MNILAIGAHPDDIELGCGGLLLKCASQGHSINMYALTRGAASGDPRQRTRELHESAKFIGATNLWIDNLEDTKLTVNDELINHIEHIINKSRPDLILTHSDGDSHHDHRAIALATVEAGRFYSNILAYEIPLTKNFSPQVYFDVSDVIDKKVRLIEIFWSQHSKLYLKANAIKGLAEYRALQSRLNTAADHVEAFEVLKLCLTKELGLAQVPVERLPRVPEPQTNYNLEQIISGT